MERENFKSRIGFLLVSAGCAIGIGNVWKFPFVAGLNGGGIFVLFYFLFLIIMGIPVLTMELAVGRAGRNSSVKAFKALEKKGSKWHIHGWVSMIGCYLLMMYYTTVSGWMLAYFFKFLTGTFDGLKGEQISGVFASLTADPVEMAIWMVITVVVGFLVCSGGIQKSLEKITKVMMGALLVLIVILAINSMTLSGAKEGLSFYLLPSVERASEIGWGKVIVAAMNQSFFTLSLGIGSMQIFGSYMKDDHTLAGESIRICALDTFVAVCAGLIIFPACFSFGVEPNAGPPLIFETLPYVFANMAGGRIWGTLFFLFMTFASFSTVTAVFQNILANTEENFGWSRKKSVILNTLFMVVASVPCILGFNLWSKIQLMPGKNILDFEDFIVSNILLPLGCIVYILFCTTKFGWGYENYLLEANKGEGLYMPRSVIFKAYLRYVLPVIVAVIFIAGII